MIKAVLFDLDGTLLDSAPDLIATLNHLRAGLGREAIPVDDLRHFASRGAIGLIKAGMPPCDDETLATWRESFLSHYKENSFVHSRPFDGVESLLSELSNRDIPWCIVTNKMEYLSFPILEKTGWLSSASAVICGDTVTNTKPHPEPVLAACRTIGVDPADALMVGDDLRDMEAGKRAGSRIAFALYGYGDSESQSDIIGNTPMIHTPEEVLGLLEVPGLEV
ncbi:MAG: HAD-IA family hydrolase [Gammaproteobacteria bacterium]|nr:HAD-IA family hydrolase [Gammaproteobacteria bacterium]